MKKKISAVIIDDERLARKELRGLLEKHKELEVIGESKNVDEGVTCIEQLKPDLVFLDIQMPEKDGFELINILEEVPKVIFVTAYDEYAIKAFEVNALDYLLKPIEPDRLGDAIAKALSEGNPLNTETDFQLSKEILGEEDQIFIKDGEKCWFVKLGEVRLFESVGNYVKVHFGENKPLVLKSLSLLETRLDAKVFFRANRKFIINLKWVEGIENWFSGGLLVALKGGEKVEISRRQAAKFKELMSL